MSGAALTLTLPMPDNFVNPRSRGSRNGLAQHFAKVAYWERLDRMQGAGLIPAPPATPIPRATLRSTMYLGGAMDEDNAATRHKVVIDWLRTRGYIATDRKKGLRWEAFPEQIVKRDGNYRLVLTLTPADP